MDEAGNHVLFKTAAVDHWCASALVEQRHVGGRFRLLPSLPQVKCCVLSLLPGKSPAAVSAAQARASWTRSIKARSISSIYGAIPSIGTRYSKSGCIHNLEASDFQSLLGVALFDRVGRRLVLNENGRCFFPKAASIVEASGELEHLFQGQHAAPLRVAASMTIGEHILPLMLARWIESHPDSPVQLQIANTAGVLRAVAAFDADIGFIEGPQSHADLAMREWMRDEMVIVASPIHPLVGRTATRSDLGRARWALRERGSGNRAFNVLYDASWSECPAPARVAGKR